MPTWEHSRMIGNNLHYFGAGVLENRVDRHLTSAGAWDQVRDQGWELVAVVIDPESGELVYYFKRPRSGK